MENGWHLSGSHGLPGLCHQFQSLFTNLILSPSLCVCVMTELCSMLMFSNGLRLVMSPLSKFTTLHLRTALAHCNYFFKDLISSVLSDSAPFTLHEVSPISFTLVKWCQEQEKISNGSCLCVPPHYTKLTWLLNRPRIEPSACLVLVSTSTQFTSGREASVFPPLLYLKEVPK